MTILCAPLIDLSHCEGHEAPTRVQKPHYAPLSIKDPQKYFVYAEATPVATATPTSNAASSGPDMDPVRACCHIVDAYEALAADDLTAQSGAPPPMAAADAMTAAQEILAAAQGDGGVDEAGRRRNPVAGARWWPTLQCAPAETDRV